MASDPSLRHRVVTLQSLQPPAQVSAAEGKHDLTSPENQLILQRYAQIMERLRQETKANGSKVMITVPDREASMLQSELARRARDGEALGSGAAEAKFDTHDWLGWVKSLLDHVTRDEAHAMVRPASAVRERISDTAKIAMAADWGTGLYGAPKIAQQIAKVGGYDLLMHLGDVYYSGTPDEVQHRFLDVWPKAAGKRTIAVNSNHEMYSGGYGYYDLALPAIGQASSYLAFENANWLLVVLDTAYVDHDMDNEQVAWLNLVIKQSTEANENVPKKLVLFSHQQLFSRLDAQGPKLQAALRHLLEKKSITAWYWGHEHQCVIFDKSDKYGLLARCLGNGGIPENRKEEVKDAPTEKQIGPFIWKRMSGTDQCPSSLALDGPNPDVEDEEDKFVPHGYMTLEFSGPKLVERVVAADGTQLLRQEIQ